MLTRRTILKALVGLPVVAGFMGRKPPAPEGGHFWGRVNPRYVPHPDGYATCHWTNAGGDGDWNNPRNWREGFLPRDGDSVVVLAGTTMSRFPERTMKLRRFEAQAGCSISSLPPGRLFGQTYAVGWDERCLIRT